MAEKKKFVEHDDSALGDEEIRAQLLKFSASEVRDLLKTLQQQNENDPAQEDEEIRAELIKLSACEISDGILAIEEPDAHGLKRGGYLEGIKNLFAKSASSPSRVAARAYTVLIGPKDQPSSLAKGTIWSDTCPSERLIVVSQPSSQRCGAVGGIHAARLQANSCTGLVVSGRVRDQAELRGLAEPAGEHPALPVWCRGRSIVGASAEGHVVSVGESIRISGVTVANGDWIVCDYGESSVVCVPQGKVREVIDEAQARSEADAKVLEWVKGGGTVRDAFAKFR